MQAGIETLFIFLVFIAISALSTWIQRRREAQEGEMASMEPAPGYQEQPRPGPGRPSAAPADEPSRSSPVSSWEQELRRLLEGVVPAAKEPPTAPSAPPVVPVPVPRRQPAPPPLVNVPATSASVSRMEDSARAYRQARAKQAEAARRLREAKSRAAAQLHGMSQVRMDGASSDIAAARHLLSNPRAARQAIIASTVLGSPKALS